MIPTIHNINGKIFIDNAQLQSESIQYSYLSEPAVAGDATIFIQNYTGFTNDQILLIESFGSETAEIVTTNGTPSVNAGAVLDNVLVYSHPVGARVTIIDYDRIELSFATTVTGTKKLLTTTLENGIVSVQPDIKVQVFIDSEAVAGNYYFARYVNSLTTSFSRTQKVFTYPLPTKPFLLNEPIFFKGDVDRYYAQSLTATTFELSLTKGGVSLTDAELNARTKIQTATYFQRSTDFTDPLVYSGWARNTVGFMVVRALADLGENLSDKVTHIDCYEWINTCLKLIQGKLKRWPEHYSYNAVLGQVTRGTNVIAMPTDAYDTETNKSLIALRIGDGARMTYVDPVSFENIMEGVKMTQVTTQAVAGQITLEIDNSYDFADSGSVNVYISGTKYTYTYTGVTRSSTAGVLTGIPASGTGAITVTTAADVYVWQDEVEGNPEVFTVRNANIEFYPLVDASQDNANMYGDYSKVATSVDSEGDTIDIQRSDMVQAYLTWRIKMKTRNNGTLDKQDGYYTDFKESMNDAIRTLPSNNKFPMRPNINRMRRTPNTGFLRKANIQELDFSEQ